MKIALVALDPRVKMYLGSKCPGVKVSFEELGVKVSGVKVPLGQSVLGSKCFWGQSVLGVKVSLGSKCRWGQSVFGVKMGVSQWTNCWKNTSLCRAAKKQAQMTDDREIVGTR